MNIEKFTQKSLEAIQTSQNIAIENQNSQVEQEHLLLALLEQEDSLIKQLLEKMNVNEEFKKSLEKLVQGKPKMVGGARQANSIYVSQDLDLALTDAEKTAQKMKDEYVSK